MMHLGNILYYNIAYVTHAVYFLFTLAAHRNKDERQMDVHHQILFGDDEYQFNLYDSALSKANRFMSDMSFTIGFFTLVIELAYLFDLFLKIL